MHDIDNFDPQDLAPLAILLPLLYLVAALILLPLGLPVLRDGQGLSVVTALAAITICSGLVWLMRRVPARAVDPAVRKAALFSASVIILAFSSYLATVAYFAIKPAIPLINSQHYDQTIITIQRDFLTGVSPAVWLINLVDDRILRFLDVAYNMFMPFLALSLMIAVYAKGLRGGVHLTIAQVLGLFTCLLIALAFPTRGPLFQYPATFMPRLADTMSGQLAQYLIASAHAYARAPERVPLLAGVAAMPSYHVFSWGCGLLYWRYLPRWALAIGVLACAVDWLSTVALGWHYESDGVVALLLIYPMWKAADAFIHVTQLPPTAPPARRSLRQPVSLAGTASGR